jgi:hypothetical protein
VRGASAGKNLGRLPGAAWARRRPASWLSHARLGRATLSQARAGGPLQCRCGLSPCHCDNSRLAPATFRRLRLPILPRRRHPHAHMRHPRLHTLLHSLNQLHSHTRSNTHAVAPLRRSGTSTPPGSRSTAAARPPMTWRGTRRSTPRSAGWWTLTRGSRGTTPRSWHCFRRWVRVLGGGAGVE